VAIEPTSGTTAAGPPGTSQIPLACRSLHGSGFVHPEAWTDERDEAERLHAALTLDLIIADDFAGYNRRALRRRRSR
jgi:hypothetical protein